MSLRGAKRRSNPGRLVENKEIATLPPFDWLRDGEQSRTVSTPGKREIKLLGAKGDFTDALLSEVARPLLPPTQ